MSAGWMVRASGPRVAAGLVAVAALTTGGGIAMAGAGPRDAAGTISTIAGGTGGPALATTVAFRPCGVTYQAGQVIVGTGHAVRAVNPRTDGLTTPVGTGVNGPYTDGGPASGASVNACPVTADHHGNLVTIDSKHDRVRAVAHQTGTFYGRAMTKGHIYTIAGDGHYGFSGNGSPATKAKLGQPQGLAVDAMGNVLIADSGTERVQVVAVASGTFYGQPMTKGDIYTIAGNGRAGFAGDGGPATAAKLKYPGEVSVDAAGNVLISDRLNNRVRVLAAATGTFYGQPMTKGDIYTIAGDGTAGFAGDGGPATQAELNKPRGTVVDAAGNLLIDDASENRVRVVAERTGTFYGIPMTTGDIYTIAGDGVQGFSGDGGPAIKAEIGAPGSVTLDAAGNVVISDSYDDHVRLMAVATSTFYGQPMTKGDIYTIAGNGSTVFSGDGGPATAAELLDPGHATVGAAENVLIADTSNNRVRIVARETGTFYGHPMTKGDIYTIAGDGTQGFTGDGGPATKAELFWPSDAIADGAGNVLIADNENVRVRVVAVATGTFYGQPMTKGDIYTIAGGGFSRKNGIPATQAAITPQTLAVDTAGNVLIADAENNLVRVVAVATGTFYGQPMTKGDIYTIAGGGRSFGSGVPATKAELAGPDSVALDAAGNVLIADTNNSTVEVVAVTSGTFYGQPMTKGDIYTIAGTGVIGFAGDGGPAAKAELSFPEGVVADAAGNVLIADSGNGRVRVVAAATGTFYGQPMTKGDIYTIAGDGTAGFAGDGGPATKAELNGSPGGVAVEPGGDVLITDTYNLRIRVVTP